MGSGVKREMVAKKRSNRITRWRGGEVARVSVSEVSVKSGVKEPTIKGVSGI